ncbi:MAG: hypothetical protein AVDCRST_MAG71-2083 [uncultured Lysobacter sp.]|uniref:Uncharacterized protein n=1 Tax=uncultured Lysobacter sp. TaxID=271060 RepID=A0A6J4LPT8_9GAMM|nr:MAG: hypothetical protein AVDCRST_MAG71-2083 [uncultured Lysobacter sp.]
MDRIDHRCRAAERRASGAWRAREGAPANRLTELRALRDLQEAP